MQSTAALRASFQALVVNQQGQRPASGRPVARQQRRQQQQRGWAPAHPAAAPVQVRPPQDALHLAPFGQQKWGPVGAPGFSLAPPPPLPAARLGATACAGAPSAAPSAAARSPSRRTPARSLDPPPARQPWQLPAVRADQAAETADSATIEQISALTGAVDAAHAAALQRSAAAALEGLAGGAASELKQKVQASILDLQAGLLERETEVGGGWPRWWGMGGRGGGGGDAARAHRGARGQTPWLEPCVQPHAWPCAQRSC